MTVQVVAPPDVTLAGAHASDDALAPGTTVTVAVVLPPSVAVNVTVWVAATEPEVAVNVIDVAAAGTVTEAMTGSTLALLDDNETEPPPAGAGWFRVTVHVVAAPDATLAGSHTSEDTPRIGVTVTFAVALPPSVAVTVTA